MLEVRGLEAFYGRSQVLFGLDFTIGAGDVFTVIGRNGAGRSTLARALVGRVAARGSIRFRDQELAGQPSHRIARAGIAYVPENREVFGQLEVEENLVLGRRAPPPDTPATTAWDLDACYALFPRLAERRRALAGALSGGEQQMLVLCRAMMGNPRLLIVDEPTEGLSPQMVELVAGTLERLRRSGLSILLIEQKLAIALRLADRVAVLGRGEFVFQGTPAELDRQPDIMKSWVEV
jgi:branched-chain amino acid transport system ATP-binding protein